MITEGIHGAGTHLLQKGYIKQAYLDLAEREGSRWHRSRERRSNSYSPFCAYMMNKKWWLEEEFTNHILRFQQVNKKNYLTPLISLFL